MSRRSRSMDMDAIRRGKPSKFGELFWSRRHRPIWHGATRHISLRSNSTEEILETRRSNGHLETSRTSLWPKGVFGSTRLINKCTGTKLKCDMNQASYKHEKNISYHLLRLIINKKVHVPINDGKGFVFARMGMERRVTTW